MAGDTAHPHRPPGVLSFDSWESYFYPETIDPETGRGTLRNRRGLRDADTLREWEASQSLIGATRIALGRAPIARTYDAEHVRAIHRELFGTVYEWAGEYRTVSMGKRESTFAEPTQIPALLGAMHRLVQDTSWDRLDQDEFARAAAGTFALLNTAHPFREGNGRTMRVFLDHVAEQSQWQFDFTRIRTPLARGAWAFRSAHTMPSTDSRAMDLDPMQDLLTVLSKRRPAAVNGDAVAPAREATLTAAQRRLRGFLEMSEPAAPEAEPSAPTIQQGGTRGMLDRLRERRAERHQQQTIRDDESEGPRLGPPGPSL